MSADTPTEYEFTCPECGERIDVNRAMKDALIGNGCVICGAAVTEADFTAGGG